MIWLKSRLNTLYVCYEIGLCIDPHKGVLRNPSKVNTMIIGNIYRAMFHIS
jgi:hypothetical protein